MPRRQISPERKAVYYSGMFVCAIGVLTIALNMIGLMRDGERRMNEFRSNPFQMLPLSGQGAEGSRSPAPLQDSSRFLYFGLGMGLIVVGFIMMSVGARGPASTGLILDPERQREETEPWVRMAGGMVKDALDEAQIDLGGGNREALPFDERIRKLKALLDDGLISKEEFAKAKAEALSDA